MPLTRRQFLSGAARGVAAATTAATVAGCADWMAGLDEKPTVPAATPAASGATPSGVPAAPTAGGFPAVPTPTPAAALPNLSATALLLNRMTFGPRPGDVERVEKMGANAYVEQQLAPETIDDGPMNGRLAQYPTLRLDLVELMEKYPQPRPQPKPDPKATPAPRPPRAQGPQAVVQELMEATVLRAVYSERQLFEMMVDFWTNHFNIYINDGFRRWAKTVDDREVIRKHALGNFKEMLTASAKSPAMLDYLDNRVSVKGKPNENYAREIMELHTLGVDGGYTYADIQNVARAFTGWTVAPPRLAAWTGSEGYVFNPRTHDDEAKTVLGATLPKGGGERDGLKVIDILCEHPATATYLATKLVRRFVADKPPAGLVARAAAAYQQSKGEIKAMLRVILASDELKASYGQKVRRPFEFVAAVLRALEVQVAGDDADILRGVLQQLGQPLFHWATPDGFPDDAPHWISTNGMLGRWNIALALAQMGGRGIRADVRTPTVQSGAKTAEQVADFWIARLLHRPLSAPDRQRLVDYLKDRSANFTLNEQALRARVPGLVALILASPDYQYR